MGPPWGRGRAVGIGVVLRGFPPPPPRCGRSACLHLHLLSCVCVNLLRVAARYGDALGPEEPAIGPTAPPTSGCIAPLVPRAPSP
jgi:hypothetical protein